MMANDANTKFHLAEDVLEKYVNVDVMFDRFDRIDTVFFEQSDCEGKAKGAKWNALDSLSESFK